MNKKIYLRIAIIVGVLVVVGLGYYVFSRVSADVYYTSCLGKTGNAYKLCKANAIEWQKLQARIIKEGLKPVCTEKYGTEIISDSSTTPTSTKDIATIKAVSAFDNKPAKDVTVRADVYIPCGYSYSKSGYKTTTVYFPTRFEGKTDSTGLLNIKDSIVKEKVNTTCLTTVNIDASHVASRDAVPLKDASWFVKVTALKDNQTLAVFENLKATINLNVKGAILTYPIKDGVKSQTLNYSFSYKPNEGKQYAAILP